jgi:antirestriction protein ArdC
MAYFHKRRSDGESSPRDHYAEITAQVIAALEGGTPPWRKPWDSGKASGPMMPHNATTGARYRGINTLVLGMSPLAFAFGDPRWATYKQVSERGWQVRKGSRGTTGFFYKKIEIPDREGTSEDGRKFVPMLRSFTLFHASQIEGVPAYVPPSVEEAPWREPESVETIARNCGAVIRVGGDRAFFSPATDHVQLPAAFAFRSPAAYASVKIHELAHWTGASGRLNRDLSGRFRSVDYAREELRAELAQVMVCVELGIEDCDFTNGVAYIAGWLTRLRDDKKEIFRAASDAQRIADYLLAFHPDYTSQQLTSKDEDAGAQEPETSAEPNPVALREAA